MKDNCIGGGSCCCHLYIGTKCKKYEWKIFQLGGGKNHHRWKIFQLGGVKKDHSEDDQPAKDNGVQQWGPCYCDNGRYGMMKEKSLGGGSGSYCSLDGHQCSWKKFDLE